jgi:hypothetical protein
MPFNIHIPLPFWFHDFILYALATGCAIMMLYQALMLGLRGVLVFGCWSWYLPFLWVSAAGFCHFVYVITWRLCLGPASRPLEKHWTRWLFSISRSSLNLTVVRPRVARFLALLFQTSGLMNYAFGTVILSGMTLVNPHIAQRITLLMLLSGLVAKVIALWLLDIYPDVEAEQVKGSEWKGEETQILAKSSPIRGM